MVSPPQAVPAPAPSPAPAPARRTPRRTTARRHLVVLVLAGLAVYAFGEVHGTWSPMHRWNRATADAALALLTLTMAVGPLVRLAPRLAVLIGYRRELGIYSVLLAAVHTAIILVGWVEWDLMRLAGFGFHPQLGQYVMVQHGFGLANLLGIVALVYGLVLMLTSSDRAVALLTSSTWKFVQRSTYVLWMLAVLHTAYFLFMHFLDYHRNTPAPNPLRWPMVAAVLLVLGLRLAATWATWRRAGRRGAASFGATAPAGS
jgi:sulfoxide reductase heme-binding subunit YedZ